MATIIPFTLSRLRKAKRLSLEQLAEKAKIDKGTIWRLENGKSTETRQATVQNLARALNVDVDVLTGKTAAPEIDDDSRYHLMSKLKFRISDSAHNALYLAADRYDVTQQEIVELAPFLFCWAAEASLRQRQDRLRQAQRACENARDLERGIRHLAEPDFTRSEEKFAAESYSIKARDLFGTLVTIDDVSLGNSDLNEYEDNPFASFLGGLAGGIGDIAAFESYGFNDFPFYRVCLTEAKELANGDDDLADEIFRGQIALNDMPKDIREIGMEKERVEWIRAKAKEHRDNMVLLLSKRRDDAESSP